MKQFPHTPRAKKVLALANVIAKELGHNFVGSEHLLLAIFRLKDGPGKAMLVACKASEEIARSHLADYYDPKKTRPEKDIESDAFSQRVLREQAQVYCRCLHTLLAQSSQRPTISRVYDERVPYKSAAEEFVKENPCDPLRTEIIYLNNQVSWTDVPSLPPIEPPGWFERLLNRFH